MKRISLGAVIAVSLSAAVLLSACTTGKSASGTSTDTTTSALSAQGGAALPDDSTQETGGAGETSATSSGQSSVTAVMPAYSSEDQNTDWSASDNRLITLNGSTVTIKGAGMAVKGTAVTISSAGTYVVSGTLHDGQLVVSTKDEAAVVIVLNGAHITSKTSAPVYVQSAEKVVLTLAAGTSNSVTDSTTFTYADAQEEEPNATIFSKDDLTINGTGSLTVTANFHNGITCKDTLRITSGTLKVTAKNNGIVGRDSVSVKSGTFTIDAGNDGIKASNDTDTAKGFVVIEGGTFTVKAGGDGIQAETGLTIAGGTLRLTTGGGSANSSTDSKGDARPGWGDWDNTTTAEVAGAKGAKAGGNLVITGGDFTIDSSDDALHSNANATIGGAVIRISSGDDGIHADNTLTITGGTIAVAKSYEGLEGTNIVVGGGTIHLTTSDDGLNAAGGNDSSSLGGRPGQNKFASSSGAGIQITGGTMVISAQGDGVDSNGSITMSGGTVLVNGPTEDNNGALDYDSTFTMSGGLLIAAGSLGMAQAPSTSSTQYAVSIGYSSQQAAGTLAHVQDAAGNTVMTFAPTKAYRSLVVCSPALKKGATYTLYAGGSSTGKVSDGLYSGGTYTAGSKVDSFTISSTVTTVGSSGGMGGRPGGGPGGGGLWPER